MVIVETEPEEHNADDISLSKESGPCQPILSCYPKTVYSKQYRCFQSSWYNKYTWLEYSCRQDSAFCFCCRWFRAGNQSAGGTNDIFTKLGYKNWQKAIQTGRGLEGHVQSSYHKACFHSWKMWQEGHQNSTSIGHQLNHTLLQSNRLYVSYIANLVRFLVMNEKPMRGTDEVIGNRYSGFFLAMIERDIETNSELRRAVHSIPKNCTYTSPESQNEIIEIWFKLVQNEIVRLVSRSEMYCVMADETRNKNNVEDMCVCIRYIDDEFTPHEYLLDVASLTGLNASEISKALLAVLNGTIGTDRLVAQSYDGASVMSGSTGGVQSLVSAALHRKIVYTHCFAHRLHLVVLRVLEASHHVTWILDICQHLYKFFRRYTVAREYLSTGGMKLKRILEQRWTGHHDSVSTVSMEFDNILQTLKVTSDSRVSEAIEACGLVQQLTDSEFLPVLHLIKEILDILMPLNMAFQSEKIDIATGIALIDGVRTRLLTVIEDVQTSVETTEEKENVAQTESPGDKIVSETSRRSSRNVTRPRHLDDYVVELQQINQHFTRCMAATDPDDNNSDDDMSATKKSDKLSLPKLKLVLIQSVLCELNARFGEEQCTLYTSAASLASNNFTLNSLKPLINAANEAGLSVDHEMLIHEIPVANVVLGSPDLKDVTHLGPYAAKLHAPSHGNLLKLYRFAMTLAVDTAQAERSFSTVKRILSDYRQSMTGNRLRYLTVLSRERDILKNISIDDFLTAFKDSNRRILI